ncbi:MAG: hypothetical protein P8049_03130 [Gemmatimonadota bacterium]
MRRSRLDHGEGRGTLGWFAAEIVVIVAGVLIALTIDSWWSAREDADRGRAYLVRIEEDLRADVGALETRLAYNAGVQRFLDAAEAHLVTGTMRDGSAWRTVVAYWHASQIWPYVSTTRTYDEMRNSGDLGLIRDPDLRAALATYYSESEVSQGRWIFGLIPEYRTQIRGLTPLTVQRYMIEACSRQDAYDNQVLTDCDPPISEADASDLLARYRAAPGILENLRYWGANLNVSDTIMGLTRGVATKLAERVGSAASGGAGASRESGEDS